MARIRSRALGFLAVLFLCLCGPWTGFLQPSLIARCGSIEGVASSDCEMQFVIRSGLSEWGCPGVTDCPPFSACTRFVLYSGTVQYVGCGCGGGGPLPWCCTLYLKPGHPNVPAALGHCDSTCPPIGTCDVEFVPLDPEQPFGDGEWVAVCQG